jgi:hypothetical protein
MMPTTKNYNFLKNTNRFFFTMGNANVYCDVETEFLSISAKPLRRTIIFLSLITVS